MATCSLSLSHRRLVTLRIGPHVILSPPFQSWTLGYHGKVTGCLYKSTQLQQYVDYMRFPLRKFPRLSITLTYSQTTCLPNSRLSNTTITSICVMPTLHHKYTFTSIFLHHYICGECDLHLKNDLYYFH